MESVPLRLVTRSAERSRRRRAAGDNFFVPRPVAWHRSARCLRNRRRKSGWEPSGSPLPVLFGTIRTRVVVESAQGMRLQPNRRFASIVLSSACMAAA